MEDKKNLEKTVVSNNSLVTKKEFVYCTYCGDRIVGKVYKDPNNEKANYCSDDHVYCDLVD
jgi:hypothetical protein